MKALALLFVFVFCAAHLYGQAQKTAFVLAKADTLYDKANDFYYDGDYKDAEREFLHLQAFLKDARVDTSVLYAKTTWKLGDVYRRLRTHEESLAFYASAEKLYAKLPNYKEQSLDLADIQLDRGRVYSQMYEPQRALNAYDSSLVVYRAFFGNEHVSVANTLMNSGLDLMKAGRYNDAEKRMLEAFEIFKVVSDSTSENFNRIYSNLGYLYRKRGDYNRALVYGNKALKIKLLNYGKNHPSVSKYYANIGKSLQALNRAEEAIPTFIEAYRIANEKLGPEHPTAVGALGELGDAYAEVGDFKKALEIYKVEGSLLEKAYPTMHPYRISYTYNLGLMYEDQGDYAAAISAYAKTRVDFLKTSEPAEILLAKSEMQIAHAYLKAGQPNFSLAYIDTAFLRIAPSLVRGNKSESEEFPLFQAELNILDLLRIRAQAYAQRSNSKDTLLALETIETAVKIVKVLRESFPSEEARQYLREDVGDLHELGILLAHRLYQSTKDADFLRRALELSDAAKSGMLKDNFREQQARNLAAIPETETVRLAKLSTTLRDARVAFGEHETPQTLEQLSNATIAYQNAETELRYRYPKYAFLKGAPIDVDLVEVQASLGPKDIFLDYVIVDSLCFVTTIQKDRIEGFEIKIPTNFSPVVSYVKNAFLDPAMNSDGVRDSTIHNLTLLYEVLIDKLEPVLNEGHALLISPWGILNQIPFSALVKPGESEGDFRRLHYLLKDFAISYRANISSLILEAEQNALRAQAPSQLLGIAPGFHSSVASNSSFVNRESPLRYLPYTAIELAGISKYFSSLLLQGEQATEENFVKESHKYRMLHLASHGRLDNREPLSSGIYFNASESSSTDDFLSAAEIYGLDLSADLAVLSACNTGAGRYQSGEGVLSLAHAFRYAGCKSVVASSWLANDQSTADITTEFYAELADGKSKNVALRSAKLHYLESADALSAHPFFWAGLTLRGDTGRIEQASTEWWLYLLGIGILGVAVFYFQKRG